MPLLAPPQVRIGTGPWLPLEPATAPAGGLSRALDVGGVEYRYWTLDLTLAGVAETVTGRLLIAGPDAASPPGGAVVLTRGMHQTFLRVVDNPETVIVPAGRLIVE